jgi:uncharacterized protein with HEPN domain
MNRDRTYLVDILEAARLAVSYVESMTEQEFLSDIRCQDSVIRRLEIMGEGRAGFPRKCVRLTRNCPGMR